MLSILGMGHAVADNVISNEFIENMGTGTTAEWIREKIGIENRVSTLPFEYILNTRNRDIRAAKSAALKNVADLALEAAQRAIKRAGIDAEQVGLVISNCCTPGNIGPSQGQEIAKRLGVKGDSYEVFTACPAFALHMDFLSNFEEHELPEYVLCLSSATLTQHVNYEDRTDGSIWGDGAAAWVVSAKHLGKLDLLFSTYETDGTRAAAVVVDTFGYFHQDGRAVRDFSVRQTVRLIKRLEEKFGLDWSKDIFVGHQANRTMLEQIVKNRNIPDSQHWHNVTNIGNQAGAGAPATLSMNWERLIPGQRVVIAVVGAGLSWGSVVLEVSDKCE